jgi:hypothetical protein
MKSSRWATVARVAPIAVVVAASAALIGNQWLGAADHIDAPITTGAQSADIADVYAFRSPTNATNVVLAMTISGVQTAPDLLLGNSLFAENTLYQIKIDNNGDAVEDLVIQGFVVGTGADQTLFLRGPAAPATVGAQSTIVSGPEMSVAVSTNATPAITTANGVSLFAGLRDDPFFFDLTRFNEIIAGTQTSFRDPGVDTLAGLNTYAIVVELPESMLGASASNVSVWATTSR